MRYDAILDLSLLPLIGWNEVQDTLIGVLSLRRSEIIVPVPLKNIIYTQVQLLQRIIFS